MKIAYIIPSLANKGPILVVKDLVAQMVKNGQQCSVFYFDEIREVEFCCPVHRIKFWKKVNFDQFDIVHSHGIRPDSYVFIYKPFIGKTKFVTTLHSYVLKDFSSQYNKIIAYVFGNLWMMLLYRHNKIVVLSRAALQYYLKWFSASRLAYAYNSRNIQLESELSPEGKKQISDFKQGELLIGVNALLSPVKGIDLLIKCLPQLPQYKLFIVGDGKSMNTLMQLAKECNVDDQVYFAGYRKDAYRYLPYYDIYAMPSRSEGFPLSILEAAIMYKPSVCSEIPIFKEIFTPEEVAFFRLEDISSLVKAIKLATSNKGMAERMHRKYLECFSPEKFYERYIFIYRSLL